MPVRHVAKHIFSEGASTFSEGWYPWALITHVINQKSVTTPLLQCLAASLLHFPSPVPPSCAVHTLCRVRQSWKIINQKNDLSYPATRHRPFPLPPCPPPAAPSPSHPPRPLCSSKFIKRVRNQEWLPQCFLIIHSQIPYFCSRHWLSHQREVTESPRGLKCVVVSAYFWSHAKLLAEVASWSQSSMFFWSPRLLLLQKWKIAGNVYLSLSIQEITCKETKRPASADTIIPAPSNTSWFRPRREGLYSTSALLCFLPRKAEGGGRGDGSQVIMGWKGISGEKNKDFCGLRLDGRLKMRSGRVNQIISDNFHFLVVSEKESMMAIKSCTRQIEMKKTSWIHKLNAPYACLSWFRFWFLSVCLICFHQSRMFLNLPVVFLDPDSANDQCLISSAVVM